MSRLASDAVQDSWADAAPQLSGKGSGPSVPQGSACHTLPGPTGMGVGARDSQRELVALRQLSVIAQPTSMASAELVSAAETVLATLAPSFYFYVGAGENRLLMVLSRVPQAS